VARINGRASSREKEKEREREISGEYKIFRTGRSGRKGQKRQKERKEVARRRWGPRKAHIRSAHILPYAYLQTQCTFAPRILESEKDDYLHRDTSSLNRPVYLLIYLSVARSVCRAPPPMSLACPPLLFLIRARERALLARTRALRETANIESLDFKCDR